MLVLVDIIRLIRRDPVDKVDVIVRVKACHFLHRCWGWAADFQLLVQAIVHDQVMRHSNTMRFHRMVGGIVVVADIRCAKGEIRRRKSHHGNSTRPGSWSLNSCRE